MLGAGGQSAIDHDLLLRSLWEVSGPGGDNRRGFRAVTLGLIGFRDWVFGPVFKPFESF